MTMTLSDTNTNSRDRTFSIGRMSWCVICCMLLVVLISDIFYRVGSRMLSKFEFQRSRGAWFCHPQLPNIWYRVLQGMCTLLNSLSELWGRGAIWAYIKPCCEYFMMAVMDPLLNLSCTVISTATCWSHLSQLFTRVLCKPNWNSKSGRILRRLDNMRWSHMWQPHNHHTMSVCRCHCLHPGCKGRVMFEVSSITLTD